MPTSPGPSRETPAGAAADAPGGGGAPPGRLKDLVLLQVLPALEAGGVEQTTLDISRAVVAAGGRSLVASAGGRLEPLLVGGGAVHVPLPLASKNPLSFLSNRAALERLIRSEGVRLVHVRSRAPAFAGIAAARRAGVPVISTYHGIYNSGSAAKRWYNGVMTRTDLVIANSEFTRRHVLAEHGLAPERVVAIPRGVDLVRFDPGAVTPARTDALRRDLGLGGEGPRPLVVLLAGRLTRWKGQTLMISALAQARRLRPELDLLLVLAGDPQGRRAYEEELRSQAAAAGLGERVRIAGHLEDMPAAYALCDLAVAPSLEPEAFGRSAVEPQAMGKPVLASDHGATAETVEEGVTGYRLPAGDVAAWAEGLVRIGDLGAAGRAAMGARGRARAARLYGLEVMQARTLEAYARLLPTAAG